MIHLGQLVEHYLFGFLSLRYCILMWSFLGCNKRQNFEVWKCNGAKSVGDKGWLTASRFVGLWKDFLWIYFFFWFLADFSLFSEVFRYFHTFFSQNSLDLFSNQCSLSNSLKYSRFSLFLSIFSLFLLIFFFSQYSRFL